MTRHEQREQVLYLLFEQCFRPDESMGDIIDASIAARELEPTEYILKTARLTKAHEQELDGLFEKHLTGWKKERLPDVYKRQAFWTAFRRVWALSPASTPGIAASCGNGPLQSGC